MKPIRILSAAFFVIIYAISILAQSPHPLDPLSREEISAAKEILLSSGKANENSRFPTFVLKEPPKSEVLSYKSGATFRREVFVVCYERSTNKTFEFIVDLNAKNIISAKEILNVQPSFTLEDISIVTSVVRADPAWQEAMKKRGITDFANVQIDAWSAGYFGIPEEAGKRLARGICFYRPKGDKNPYPHPIEGVTAVVDLSAKKMLKLVDTGVVPVPDAKAELDFDSNKSSRAALKPLQILQPNGSSFSVNGNEIIWQNWHFRYALHPREGLVLYTVGYEDQGKIRSILYRGSLSEMVVPYGDAASGWFIRNAFDEGEYGVGTLALPLEEKIDVPENAVVMPAVLASERGNPQTKPRVVALYERDGGVLWKHADWVSGKNESRRARQLVLSSYCNVGNYEYGFNWVFHQDGTLEMEVNLTGVMSVKAVVADAKHDHKSSTGHIVAPGIEAVHHQHFFNFRLDMDVDGSGGNSVIEQNTQAALAGKNNPYNNVFTMQETLLKRELAAQRQLNLASNRKWKIVNEEQKNSLGQSTGYSLLTGENSVSFSGLKSYVRQRAGFMNHHLWVTQFAPDEMNAAGFYINQSKGGEGLPKWTKANRSIEKQDVVVWYSMGITHIPRPEDWPVMPVHKAGFKLVPTGFFERNPAMDVGK